MPEPIFEDDNSDNKKNKVTDYLNNWDDSNTNGRKILIVSVIFLSITSFFIYRLTTALDDRPLFNNNTAIKERNIRLSKIEKTNDSLDRIEELIQQRKSIKMNEYFNTDLHSDSLDINKLLNNKND